MKPESAGNAGGGGESARYNVGTPRASAPEQKYNAEERPGYGNCDAGPVGVLRGALTGGSRTVGRGSMGLTVSAATVLAIRTSK